MTGINMNLSTLTVYFLLLRIYPVIAVKDSNDHMIRKSSYINVIQDVMATGDYTISKTLNGKDRLRGNLDRKNFLHAKKEEVNNNRLGAKRIKKGEMKIICNHNFKIFPEIVSLNSIMPTIILMLISMQLQNERALQNPDIFNLTSKK